MDDNTHNTVEEQTADSTANDGGDAVDPVDQEVDDAVSSAVDALGLGENDVGVSGSDEDDDTGSDDDSDTATGNVDGGDADPDEDEADDTDAGEVDDTAQIDRSDAVDALIQSGMSLADVQKLSDSEILKLGAEKLAEQGEQPEEAAEEQAEEEASVSDDELMKLIGDELGDDFSKKEKEKISKALIRAVDAKRLPKLDVEPIRQEFSAAINEVKGLAALVGMLSSEVQELSVERAKGNLSEAFPQLSEQGNMDKVLAKAEKFMPHASSIQDAIEMAAFSLYGREQAQKMTKHNAKIGRMKKKGAPTKRSTVSREDHRDEVTTAAVRAVEEKLNL